MEEPRSRRRAVSTSCEICPHFRFSFMPCCPMIYSSSQTILTGRPGGEWQRKERGKALYPHLFVSLSCGWHSVNSQVQNMLPPTCSSCLASFTLMPQVYNGIYFKATNDADDGCPQGHQESEEDKEALLWSSETFLQNSFQTNDLLPLLTTKACWGHASEVSRQWVLEGRF